MRTSTFGQQRSWCFNLLYNESYQWFEGKLIMIPDIHPVASPILMKFSFPINFHVVQNSIKLEIMNETNNIDLFSISARTLWPFLYFPDGWKATPTRWKFSQINASTREPSVHAVKNWICSAKQQPGAYRKIWLDIFIFPTRVNRHVHVHLWFSWCYESAKKRKNVLSNVMCIWTNKLIHKLD